MKKSLSILKTTWFRTTPFLLGVVFAAGLVTMFAAQATYPVQIGFTLEGCRLETGATYDQATFTCTDEGYTTGNLGKQWNELDYVPHRVHLKNGGDAQTFDFLVAGDYTPNSESTIGWDDITALTLNTSLSDASCDPVISGPVQITDPGDGVGGAFETIYRQITATMAAGETCVYDYAQRLSLGASEFSGSSLQSNLWNEDFDNSNIGQKRIQLPVADILPQELNKDMSAQQDTNFIWNLTKTATPTHLPFLDSCERDDPMTETATIRVEWERIEGEPGMVTVVTNIYATNPAHLDVLVSVEDSIFGDIGGGEVLLDTETATDVPVPAGATVLLLTHSFSAPSNVSGLNDVATATYKIGAIEVPGDTDATASADVQPSGTASNETAVITDVEGPITGEGYSFSVDSVDGDGTFDGYILGSETVGQVTWVSNEQDGAGSVEFVKTIYLDQPRNSSGELPDVATLVSEEFEVSQNAAVTFADSPMVDLTIHKTIDQDILGEGESATFFFDVSDSEGVVADDVPITIEAGQTSGSAVVEGLEPGVEYSVVEVSGSDGFLLDPDTEVLTIVLPLCGGEVSFQNEAESASARAIKVTVPEGEDPSGFEFVLTGEGIESTVVSDADGNAVFPDELAEGTYVITEVPREGWELTDVIGDNADLEAGTCSFTVDLPEDAGFEFLCTFENTRLATIIITKRVEGNDALDLSGDFSYDSTAGEFDALLAGESWSFVDATSGDEVSHTFVDLSPGTYDVTEAEPPLLWGFTDLICDDPDGGTTVDADPFVRTATIDLDPGETVECTFVNTKLAAPGNLIIYKTTIGGVGTFNYTSSDGTLPDFDIETLAENAATTDADATFMALEPGFYKVNEIVPEGWELTNLFCNDDTSIDGNATTWSLATGEATVSIDNAETVECFYEDTRNGRIRLHKVTDPSGDPQQFTFSGDLSGAIGDGESLPAVDYMEVAPGSYSSTETVPDGWDLTGIVCEEDKDADSSGAGETAMFNVQPGETVDCTFTNTKLATIIVTKRVEGNNALDLSGSFSYDSTNGDFDALLAGESWSFADALSGAEVPHTFDNLSPGTYDVTEAEPPLLWGFTDLICEDPDGGTTVDADPGVRTATIDLDPGETVECTFVNTKLAAPGNLIIHKTTIGGVGTFNYTSSDGTLSDFDIETLAENVATTDADATFNGLEPGFYKVNEIVPEGWELTDLFCTDDTSIDGNTTTWDLATGEVTVSIDNAETVECFYEDTRSGRIRLHKVTDPSGDPQQFTFSGDLSGAIGDGESLPAVDYMEVAPGSYSSTETVPAGWDLTGIVCEEDKDADSSGAGATATFNVQPGETVDCTFTNTKRGMADLLKTVAGGLPDGMTFDFEIRSDGSVVATATSDPATGEAVFSCVDGLPETCVNVDGMAKLLPGDYAFCELNLAVGWENVGTVEDGAVTELVWYNPDPEDNSLECVDFSLAAGETLHFSVDNVPPPGGDARTIGYWKNWSSCTKGNQFAKYEADIADGTLDEFNSLDHHLPIDLYPGFAVDSCELGVAILDKRDADSGRKMAGDPAYGLAAQLLGVQLNLDSDAGFCPALTEARLAAEALLADIGFDATGSYLKGNAPQATEARNLAGILDAYNNNELCP